MVPSLLSFVFQLITETKSCKKSHKIDINVSGITETALAIVNTMKRKIHRTRVYALVACARTVYTSRCRLVGRNQPAATLCMQITLDNVSDINKLIACPANVINHATANDKRHTYQYVYYVLHCL